MAQALEASEPSVPSATSTPAFLTVFLAAWRDMVCYERGVWASPYYVYSSNAEHTPAAMAAR